MKDPATTISGHGAKQLVEQLIRMGYFHDYQYRYPSESVSPPRHCDDDLEIFRKVLKDPPRVFSTDIKCKIIPSSLATGEEKQGKLKQDTSLESFNGYYYYTQSGLINALVRKLEDLGGRHPLNDLAEKLHIDPKYFLQKDSIIISMLPSSVQILGLEFVSGTYWKKMKCEIQAQVKEQKYIQVLDLASRYSLPMDSIVHHCLENLKMTRLIFNGRTIASEPYLLGELKNNVITTFQQLKVPTSVSAICQKNNWDPILILEWISNHDMLAGELHVDPNNTTMAIFSPKIYGEKQQQGVLDFISANGFMTEDQAKVQGMTMAQVTYLIKQYFTDVIELKHVLLLGYFVQNVQGIIQEISSHGIMDLREYLPAELTEKDILQSLLKYAGFTPGHGVDLIFDKESLIVSRGFINEVAQNTLPPLIESFAKTKAEQIYNSARKSLDDEGEGEDVGTRKGRLKSRTRKSGRSKKVSPETIKSGTVPLLQVAIAVLAEYPEFANNSVEQDLLDQACMINWEDEENTGSLVIEFCKRALYSDKFRSNCEEAVKAELQRLKSATDSKSTLSRKDNAAKVRSIESTFEEAFVTCCYMIQASVKFISLAEGATCFDENHIEVLKQELLQGYCAELTSRITQYCLFKDEEEGIFTFRKLDELNQAEATDPPIVPEWCLAVDTVARNHNQSYLSCPPPREPLPVLRESLSGNKGVSLARQWTFCGGQCYRGGIRSSDDCTPCARPGDLTAFLSHVEENCLTVCGMPFKKLDKKAEKQLLFRRRLLLVEILQKSYNPIDVLELTIMILFQQVKQVIVYGSLLRGPILRMLVDERKLAGPIASALNYLNQKIYEGETVNDDLVNAVRECGLCRDVSKYDMPGIEELIKQ